MGRMMKYPFCSNGKGSGPTYTIKQRQEDALRQPWLRIDGERYLGTITHDIDQENAEDAYKLANLPPPNLIATNPENGHAHLTWVLTFPVDQTNRKAFA
jgi:hypothetical protein